MSTRRTLQNVLVTGGAGFIGSSFVRQLLVAEPRAKVVTLDALTYAGLKENLADLPHAERHAFVQGDICDGSLVRRLLREHTIETVVHFAAESHVDRSIVGPAPFVETNVVGTFTLLEAVRHVWIIDRGVDPASCRFHHVSTDEVFGSLAPDAPPAQEESRYAPGSPYAASKAACDHFVRAYGNTYQLPVTLSNAGNNYGPRQFPEKLIPLVILNALEARKLPIYGDGQNVRDWIFVEDHCDALIAALRAGVTGRTYNISSETQIANLDLVQRICAILDLMRPDAPHRPHASLIEFVADRPGHDRRYAMDGRRVRNELGWRPHKSLDEGLQETIAWYIGHPQWVRAARQADYDVWVRTNYATRGTARP